MFKINAFLNKLRLSNGFRKILEFGIFIAFSLFFALSLSLEALYPFNLINIGFFLLFVVFTFFHYILYGFKFIFGFYIFVLAGMIVSFLSTTLVFFFSTPFPTTPILMLFMSSYIFLWIKQSDKNFDWIFKSAYLSVILFVIIFVIFEKDAVLSFNISDRAIKNLGNANDIAMNTSFMLLICLSYFFKGTKKIFKLASVFIALILMYFILITGSMSMLLFAVVSTLVVIYFFFKKKAYYFIFLLSSLTVIIITIFSIPALGYFKDRFLGLFSIFIPDMNVREDASAISRIYAANFGFSLFLSSPLFGNGYGSVFRNYSAMAHNNIAEICSDFGIFALLLEEVKILYPIFCIKNVAKKNKPFVVASIVFLFILQFSLVFYDMKGACLLLPLIYGCIDNEHQMFNIFKARTIFYFKNEYKEIHI